MRLQTFTRETRMYQANCCAPVFFSEIEAHKRFRWIWLPVWQPGELEHVRWLDRPVFSSYGEGSAEGRAAHLPFATNPQIGLNVGGLKTPFGAPPLLALFGIGQRRKDALGWCFDRYFLDDGFACTNRRHRLSST